MRVIGGKARGTKLMSLKGASLRPTLDRVRESFFNQISPVVEGANFLDLFSGTGAVGIEALSRGAQCVVFVEPDRMAQNLILDNLKKCRFLQDGQGNDWELLRSDALLALQALRESERIFDLVYVDPPYEPDVYDEVLTALSDSGLLNDSSQVIVEHFRKRNLEDLYGKLSLFKSRRLGDSCLSFYSLGQMDSE